MSKEIYAEILESQYRVKRQLDAMIEMNKKREEEQKGIKYHIVKPFLVMSNMSLLAWVVVGVMAGLLMVVGR